MLTPIEIQAKTFKSGIGYDKKDVESFFKELLSNYEFLYKENIELADKLSVLNEGIQYYKTIEKTLQKALVLAEKTAEDTMEAAKTKALAIEQVAHSKANLIVSDSKNELDRIHLQTIELIQQYDKYKIQFHKMAEAQLEILNSKCFQINLANVDAFISQDSLQKDKTTQSNETNSREEIISKEELSSTETSDEVLNSDNIIHDKEDKNDYQEKSTLNNESDEFDNNEEDEFDFTNSSY